MTAAETSARELTPVETHPRAETAEAPDSPPQRDPETGLQRSTLLAQAMAANALAIAALVFFAVIVLNVHAGFSSQRTELVSLMLAIAAALTLNIFILRRQFAPLEQLVATMDQIDLTFPGARAELPHGATEDVAELILAFNDMIERIEHERKEKMAAAVNAQESERARVARDLHDEANQALTAVILRLEAAAQAAPPALAAEIGEAKQLAAQAMEELLEVARRLRPTVLDLGLRNALSAQVNDFGDRTGITARFIYEGGSKRRLDSDSELALYRVAQEALSNIAQHADATHVEVRLEMNGSTRLVVQDNGRGFDPTAPTGRFGVSGMRERALLVDANLAITSAPGDGTTIRLELA